MAGEERDEILRRNRLEYSDSYDKMKWLSPVEAKRASRLRENLIKAIFKEGNTAAGWKFSGTKLFLHDISPGCTLCGKGDWSCLFINGICNAHCFYCPSTQNEKGLPGTSTLEFSSARDYADYVRAFNIQGVSFSGGEPFITFDQVLLFLKTLRSRITRPLYIWMYTNGLLVTEDKLKALRDHGLDEIRFDVSANHYRLEALKKALGVIPRVTVEIPAIPEDLEILKQGMKELCAEGVNHLNLHQIRCTPYNKDRLMQRGYTFLHGPRVTVLETELAALQLILYALNQNIALPINYCSFTYRHQFQKAGSQKRNSLQIKAAHEDITPTGHIRTMSLCGDKKEIGAAHQRLLSQGGDASLWRMTKDGEQIQFAAALWPSIHFSNMRLKVGYSSTSLKSAVSFLHPFKEVKLNNKKKVVIERHVEHAGIWLQKEQIPAFAQAFLQAETDPAAHTIENLPQDLLNRIRAFESFTPGLAQYY